MKVEIQRKGAKRQRPLRENILNIKFPLAVFASWRLCVVFLSSVSAFKLRIR